MSIEVKDIVKILLLRGKTILLLTFVSTILFALLLFFVYPLTFEAGVSIMPPENEQGGGLSSLIQGAEIVNLLGAGAKGNSQIFAEILRSRTASEYVNRKLHLEKFLDVETAYDAVLKLQVMVQVEVTKEGIVRLAMPLNTPLFGRLSVIKDSIRTLAATISNSYIRALDSINREKNIGKARRARVYIERQIEITKKQLDTAELKLSIFQQENKTVSLPDQIKATIESASKIKGEIIQTEVQLNYLSTNMDDSNQVILSLKKKLESLKQEYAKFDLQGNDYFVSFGKTPQLGLRLANFTREVKILNEVYLLLQQQFYRENIQEKKDLPTIEMLDPAIPPLKQVAPRFTFSVVSGFFFILSIISLFMIIRDKEIFNYLNSKKNREE